jgi:enterochelin esterase-like enzyme
VVLDRNGDYAYGGRGPGDLLSKVVTVRFPLISAPSIALEDAVPPAAGQFDTAGLPPRAAEQITASRAHLHEETITSEVLTRFRGTERKVAAWVLTPPGYDPKAQTTYPTVYTAGGFGTTHKLDGQQLSRIWHLMETGAMPPMIWVALDDATATGTTEFADSVNNGPWGLALVTEVIPTLEARYRMDAKPSGRFLTGHSSGGWFALWTMVRYPTLFGGSWATSPDPVDFHDFLGADLCEPGANMYRDSASAARPLERDHGKVMATVQQAAKLEATLGRNGGQLRSFEWTFSPRRRTGPLPSCLIARAAPSTRRWLPIGARITTSGIASRRTGDG